MTLFSPCPFSVLLLDNLPSGAISSAVEHYIDIVGVAGSNPASPTSLSFEPTEHRLKAPANAGFFVPSGG